MSDKLKGFIVNLVAGLVVAAGVVALNWSQDYSLTQRLCDGFFVAAVLLLGMGGLKHARNKGTFDMAAYSISSVLHTSMPFLKMNSPLEERQEEFVEYQARKSKERKPAGDVLLAGAVYLILAAIMLIAYLVTAQ